MQKLLTFFFQQKHVAYMRLSNDKSFNDTLTNDIVSFEQLGPGCQQVIYLWKTPLVGGALLLEIWKHSTPIATDKRG